MDVFRDVTPQRLGLGLLALAAIATAQPVLAAPMPQDADAAAYDKADAQLNAVYGELARSLDDAGRKALRDEERQWIFGRDSVCKVPTGTVVKNQCTTNQAAFRADELTKRLKSGAGGGAFVGTGITGDWGYASDCNMGHFVEFHITKPAPTIAGTWSDGTRVSGSQGKFRGEWLDNRIYLRFCADEAEKGGYPVCPAYGKPSAYVIREADSLAWYRAWGSSAGSFDKYVTMVRKPADGNVPTDTSCTDDGTK